MIASFPGSGANYALPIEPLLMPFEPANYEEIVQKRTVLIAITLRKLGVKRKVDSQTQHIQTDTDRGVLAIQKVLLIAPELDKIKKLDGKIRTDLRRLTLPDETLRRGWYLLAKDMVAKVDTLMEDYRQERQGYVNEFKTNYWARIKEAEPRLKGMFDYRDYPSVEELDIAFGMDIDYRDTVGVPKALADVGDGIIHERQQQKMAADCQRIVKEVEQGLTETLQQMTAHLVARLGRQDDGKLMVFKDTTVTHFKEFVENLQAMNVTGNIQIEELGKKAQALLTGVNPDGLRKDESLRATVKQNLEVLKKEIDGSLKPAGRRFAWSMQEEE